jgi:hypothetical protein
VLDSSSIIKICVPASRRLEKAIRVFQLCYIFLSLRWPEWRERDQLENEFHARAFVDFENENKLHNSRIVLGLVK